MAQQKQRKNDARPPPTPPPNEPSTSIEDREAQLIAELNAICRAKEASNHGSDGTC